MENINPKDEKNIVLRKVTIVSVIVVCLIFIFSISYTAISLKEKYAKKAQGVGVSDSNLETNEEIEKLKKMLDKSKEQFSVFLEELKNVNKPVLEVKQLDNILEEQDEDSLKINDNNINK